MFYDYVGRNTSVGQFAACGGTLLYTVVKRKSLLVTRVKGGKFEYQYTRRLELVGLWFIVYSGVLIYFTLQESGEMLRYQHFDYWGVDIPFMFGFPGMLLEFGECVKPEIAEF